MFAKKFNLNFRKNQITNHGLRSVSVVCGCLAKVIVIEFASNNNKTHNERLISDLFTTIAIIGMIPYVVPFIRSGEGDFAKNWFLFTVCLGVMLISEI